MTKSADGAVLRAELLHRGRCISADTLEISDSLVFVQTEESADIGERVELRLSFSGFLSPLDFETHVVAHRLSTTGKPGGWSLGFVFKRDDDRGDLMQLIELLHDPDLETPPPTVFRVLLCEESKLVREVFEYSLERYFREHPHSVRVEAAQSTADAWQRLQSSDYDLVIAENAALIARIRQDEHLEDIPVIAVGAADPEARTAALEAGADRYLNKPIVLGALFTSLESLIQPDC